MVDKHPTFDGYPIEWLYPHHRELIQVTNMLKIKNTRVAVTWYYVHDINI